MRDPLVVLTLPQARQWCRRFVREKLAAQREQLFTAVSGTQIGATATRVGSPSVAPWPEIRDTPRQDRTPTINLGGAFLSGAQNLFGEKLCNLCVHFSYKPRCN